MNTVVVIIMTFINTNGYTYCDFKVIGTAHSTMCERAAERYNLKMRAIGKDSHMLCMDNYKTHKEL